MVDAAPPAPASPSISCPAVGHSRSGCKDTFPAGRTVTVRFLDGCRDAQDFVLSWGAEDRWTARTAMPLADSLRFRPDDGYWMQHGIDPPADVRGVVRLKSRSMVVRNAARQRPVTVRWTLDCARD